MEGDRIRNRNDNEAAGHVRWINLGPQAASGLDPNVFRAMHAFGDRDARTFPFSIDRDDRHFHRVAIDGRLHNLHHPLLRPDVDIPND